MTVISVIISIWVVVSFFCGIGAAYTAFVSKKDERMKMIVIKSMAHSFAALLTLYTIQLIIRLALWENYATWWDNFTSGIYIHPLALCLIFLGTFTVINTRRFSASE